MLRGKNKLARCLVLLTALLVPLHVSAGDLRHFRGIFTELYYTDDADLAKVDSRVSIRWLKGTPSNIRDLSLQGAVSKKFDVIRVNVESILDMYPRGRLVRFNILGDHNDVREVLFMKFKNSDSYDAFYSKRDQHIYLAAESVNTNIVAHELAHAVVDLELGSEVPETVHEILAKYVDVHLYD